MTSAVERGGPFGRKVPALRWRTLAARLRRRYAAATGHGATESSPLGGAKVHPLAILVLLLGLAGFASFGEGAWLTAKAQFGQWLLERAFERTLETGQPQKPWPWADTHPVARITVPETTATVLVLAGASGRTLAWGPGHLDDSAPLGGAGNAIVSAHRDTHFRFLRRVGVGDDLELELADGSRQHYRVRERYVADAHELRLPRHPAVPTLTLVTCYPFDALLPGGPLRLVVVAEPR